MKKLENNYNSNEESTKYKKVSRIIKIVLLILVCLIPSIILAVFTLNQFKKPENIDFEYANVIWNEGISEIPYKNINVSLNESIRLDEIYNNGFSNFADKGASLNITINNGDEIELKGNKAKILSNSILGGKSPFYEIEYIEGDIKVSLSLFDMIFNFIIWLFVLLVLPIGTILVICGFVILIEIFIEEIRYRKKYKK